jgi:NADH:ubiquinone oxidoreductase subunit 3 (subunit A)
VQRIIIAVFLLLILAAAMFLQRLIRTEEAVDEEAAPWETAESFAGEVEERA